MNVNDMAKAHLEAVRNAISDLAVQKSKIENEMVKLSEYIKQGEQVVTDFEHVNSGSDLNFSVDTK